MLHLMKKSTWVLNKVQHSPSSLQRVDDLIDEPTIEEAHDDHGNSDFSLEPPSSDSSSAYTSSSSTSTSPPSTPPRKWGSLREVYEQTKRSQLAQFEEPKTFEEAAENPTWCVSMDEEMKFIKRNNTWELVDLPKGKKVVGLKWVYKLKYKPNGLIQKHKARLVARGHMQEEQTNFSETFSVVARFDVLSYP